MLNIDTELNIPTPTSGRVVIIGGGFAGMAAVKELSRSDIQVVVIDRNNYHQFQPLLYQVATSGLEPTSISFPLRAFFSKYKSCYFRMANVTQIDRQNNVVKTSIGDLDYDHLIIAAGADTNYFGMANIEKDSLPLKSVGEALALRNHLYRTMEKVINISDPQEREAYLNFVIVGGGATGVELAGALAELRRHILPKDYKEIDFSQMRIYLINATDRLLEAFSESSSARALKDLRQMGIEVLLSSAVTDYKDNLVYYDNNTKTIPTRSLIWASGIIANKFEGVDEVGRGRRIKVDQYNRVEGSANLYAVGDIAIMQPSGHPQVAQVALQQGRNTGRNIIRITRKQEPVPFEYKDKGSMATIGRNMAVAEIGKMKLSGFIAWVTWLFIHLFFIISVRNKLRVFSDWAWSYVTHDQPLRSIIESKKKHDN